MTPDPFGDYYGDRADRHAEDTWSIVPFVVGMAAGAAVLVSRMLGGGL
ncbi:MAG: hypothetical protein AB7K86_08435 [Rhodospirillales bacterium]